MNKRIYNYSSASLYGIVHALVDCACAIGIFGGIGDDTVGFAYVVALYNLIAFVFQPIIGWYADWVNKYRMLAFLGCALVILGLCISPFSWVAIGVFGLGNALFHVAAGAICLNMEEQKIVFAGIFVAPGDIGLMAGTLIGKSADLSLVHIIALGAMFSVMVILILAIDSANKNACEVHAQSVKVEREYIGLTTMLFSIVITVRAFIGATLSFSWVNGAFLVMVLAIFVSVGKAAGGLIADKIGSRPAGATALLIAAPLLAFFPASIVTSLAGILLFNMTMPITMTAIFRKMPKSPAFSFGIAAMALIPGFYAGNIISVSAGLLLLIIIITAALLYYALRLSEKREGDKNEEA